MVFCLLDIHVKGVLLINKTPGNPHHQPQGRRPVIITCHIQDQSAGGTAPTTAQPVHPSLFFPCQSSIVPRTFLYLVPSFSGYTMYIHSKRDILKLKVQSTNTSAEMAYISQSLGRAVSKKRRIRAVISTMHRP